MRCNSAAVVQLNQIERVAIDPVRFLMLRRELGDAAAAVVVQRVFEGMSATITAMETLRASPQQEEFHRMGRRMSRLATQVGLSVLSRVAEDVVALAQGNDTVAAEASWARLRRLSDAVLGIPGASRSGRG